MPVCACILIAFTCCGTALARKEKSWKDQVLVVRKDLPTDSRGEPVYDLEDQLLQGQPAVPGKLEIYKLLHLVDPEMPASLRQEKRTVKVQLDGVAACNGDAIDFVIAPGAPPAAARAAMAAVLQYKLRPATLDGKPIAMHVHVEIRFDPD